MPTLPPLSLDLARSHSISLAPPPFLQVGDGKNLTDQPFVTYQNDDPRQVIDYQRYGRDYYLGLTYKF